MEGALLCLLLLLGACTTLQHQVRGQHSRAARSPQGLGTFGTLVPALTAFTGS